MSQGNAGGSWSSRRRAGTIGRWAALGASVLTLSVIATGPAGASVPAAQAEGHAGAAARADRYGFDSPDAAAVSGNDLFVANRGNNSITELNATTGAFVRRIAGSQYAFNEPTALGVVGSDLFVANAHAGLTELRLVNGALVSTLRGAAYHFSDPVSLASNGSNALYVLSAGGAVTAIATATGAVLGVATGSAFHFDHATAIAYDKSHLFVTDSAGDTVTEISAATMRLAGVLRGSEYGFRQPTGVAAHGDGVWVTNFAGPSLTELSASTGAALKVVPNWEGNLPNPGPITYGDGFFYAASPPGTSPMITQIKPSADVPMPWMMCNTNGPYKFANPEALVVANSRDLWVVNEGSRGLPGNSLTEMRTTSGKWIRTIR